MGSKEGKTGIVREVLSFFLYVAIVVGITFLIIHFVGQRTYVSGSSMENTLSDGDNLIVDKLTYRFSDPKRFDIIVFPYKYQIPKGLILLYFHINMRKIHILSNES